VPQTPPQVTDTPEFPPVALGGHTELRIHGVSGTPTTSMLRDPHPTPVWGDKTAGFFRRARDTEPPEPDRRVEAYSWGGLTAGAGARAAWLLLLPFMLVNVAAWAHPVRRRERYAPVGWMSGALRALGLLLTGALLVAAAILGMDVLAWQCAGAPATCGSHHFYTKWLTHGWVSHAGPRIAVGAIVPVAVLVAMYLLSRSTAKNYEHYGEDETGAPPPPPATAPAGVRDLANPRFWRGGGPLDRLRALHVTAAAAGIAGLVAWAARAHDPSRYATAATLLAWLCLAVIAAVTVLLLTPITGRRRELLGGTAPNRAYCTAVRYGPRLGVVLVLVTTAYAAFLTRRPRRGGALPGTHAALHVLVIAQVALLLVLTVATYVALRDRDTTQPDAVGGPVFRGYAAPVLALFGLMLGAVYTAGAVIRVTDVVGNPTIAGCGHCPKVAMVIPDEYVWSARAFVVAAALAVVAAVVGWRLKSKALPAARTAVASEYGRDASLPRTDKIARIHTMAALSDHGPALLEFVLLGTCAVTAVLWGLFRHEPWLKPLGTAGAWLVGADVVALLGVGRKAYKNVQLRRTVGILWDLGTFWPRAAHPFAPPCYCERSVPEFVTRIRQLRGAGGHVVVSAHSQGTVIAVAALLQLHGESEHVGLLTYGAPLHRFYARAFPHFYGLPVLRWTGQRYDDRWINLYRLSDPIGGPAAAPVGGAPAYRPDLRLRDPAYDTPPYAFKAPRARGHSDYFDDAAYGDAVSLLAAEV
jgi:hypothetical protein